MAVHGFSAAYSLIEAVGRERAFGDPAAALADVAAVAAGWHPEISAGAGE